MAEIIAQSGGGKKSLSRQLRVDMTPMVDLGFLLITFFIFTAVADTPRTLKLLMPVDSPSSTLTPESKTLTVLLTAPGEAVCYEGRADDSPALHRADMTTGREELRHIILAKQQVLRRHTGTADSMVVVIKPGQESNYQQLIATLDEMIICGVKKHAIATWDESDRLLVSFR